jgi:hypothetical protein
MKKLFTPFLLILTLGSFAQQVNTPNSDFEKFRVPQEEFELLKRSHSGNSSRSDVGLYIDYPVTDEIEQGLGEGINYLWTFNSNYTAAADTDIIPINFVGVRLLELIGYTDPLLDPIETYSGPFAYPNSLQITIDSVFVYLTHENNSGEDNKLFVDIRKLSTTNTFAAAQPILWTDSVVTNTSLSSSGNWLGVGAGYVLALPVGYTTTVGQKVGLGLRYIAPKSDTLGIAAAYVSNPNGPASPGDYAMKSKFPYSVIRWEGFNNGNFSSTGGIWYTFAAGQTDTSYFKAQNWQIWTKVSFSDVTGIKKQVMLPIDAGQNSPNPFSHSSQVSFSTKENQALSLVTYNVEGREVLRTNLGYKTQGTHQIELIANDLASGTYFYRLEGEKGFSTMNKMVVVH